MKDHVDIKIPEVIHRSACVFEVIVRDKEKVDAYVLLLKKRNPEHSWWEVPGGEIEQGEKSHVRGIIEMVEEAGISISKDEILTGLEVDASGRNDSSPILELENRRIINTPFVARREVTELPKVNFFSKEPEHEDFAWLNVTGIYKEPRKHYFPFLYAMNAREIIYERDPINPKIISLGAEELSIGNSIHLSDVTGNILKRYVDHIVHNTQWVNPRGLKMA